MLIEDTPLTSAALPLEPFKAHLRMGSGFGQETLQDAVLAAFLRAALAAVEARTGKVLIRRAFTLTVSAWQEADAQALPVVPVSAVTQMEQVSSSGERLAVDADGWWLEQDSQRPKLRARGSWLPAIPQGGTVVMQLVAGMSPDWDRLPGDLQQAVLMLAAHYYEYRNDTGLGDGCMPFGVTSLLERYRPMRLGALQ